jgi:hypothetical protein
MTLLLVAQLTIVASRPPLKPADAVRVLQHTSRDLDLSKGLFPLDALPFVIQGSLLRSASTDAA